MRFAALIGIEQYARPEDLPGLAGCRNDVDDMAAYLSETAARFDARWILREAEATKRGVMALLAGAVEALRSGDELVVHYSGHGAPYPWRNAVHEAICPHDFDWSRDTAILAVDLMELLCGAPGGARVSIVTDCCYSGGLQPSYEALVNLAGAPPHRIRTIPVPPDVAADIRAFRGATDTAFADLAAVAGVAVLTACGAAETAAESTFCGRVNGIMTRALLTALRAPAPPQTAAALAGAVAAELHQFGQTPALHAPASAMRLPFLL